jgi:hypothetical protein
VLRRIFRFSLRGLWRGAQSGGARARSKIKQAPGAAIRFVCACVSLCVFSGQSLVRTNERTRTIAIGDATPLPVFASSPAAGGQQEETRRPPPLSLSRRQGEGLRGSLDYVRVCVCWSITQAADARVPRALGGERARVGRAPDRLSFHTQTTDRSCCHSFPPAVGGARAPSLCGPRAFPAQWSPLSNSPLTLRGHHASSPSGEGVPPKTEREK